MARPSKYSVKLGLAICERMALGDTVRDICQNEAMPAESTVRRWALVNEGFSALYAQARERQADAWFDKALTIASCADMALDPKVIPGARLHVDTLKWAAAKLRPRSYSDKVQIEQSGITEVVVRYADDQPDAD